MKLTHMEAVKVLIVDDEPNIRDLLSTSLRFAGFSVHAVANGADAVHAAEKGEPDIILLDIIMPKMDGFAALKKLKKNAATKNIPVILLTNLGQEEDIQKGKELGAIDYFIKANHTPQEVVDKVKSVLS